jgi:hypothetical protein
MGEYFYQVLYVIDHMEPKHWVMALAAVIAVGYLCMKGIGARSNY